MKLHALAPVLVTLATALITGCGPGLTTRANAPTNLEAVMDMELSHALSGTTELTSASLPLPLPAVRTPLEPWSASESAVPVQAPVQTWGADAALDPKFNAEYGF